jgi:site-specific DNA-methyltransferase (adenine-specific)
LITLHLGDCLDVLRTLEPGSVDAVVTDPPYNVGFKYASVDDNRSDYAEWCGAWFALLGRACRGPIALTPGMVNVAMWCGIRPPKWIIAWHKPAAMGRSPVGFCNWEPALLYGKPHHQRGCDVVRATIKPDRDLDGHPCPKPVQWGVGFVELLTVAGMTVLDPFAGSGTTGVACARTGRNFIGVEIDPTYHAIAQRRIADEQAKTALLEPVEVRG